MVTSAFAGGLRQEWGHPLGNSLRSQSSSLSGGPLPPVSRGLRSPPVVALYSWFSSVLVSANKARTGHPSGSRPRRRAAPCRFRAGPWRPWTPQRTSCTPPPPFVCIRSRGSRSSGPTPRWLTARARRVRADAWLGGRRPIRSGGSKPTPWPACRPPSVQPKQRSASNGTSSRITWKQARASLCATAFLATTGLLLAFLRS